MPRQLANGRLSTNHNRYIVDDAGVADFEADLITSLNPRFGFGLPTFTRATTATVMDFEGLIKNTKSDETRFEGARRVENLVTSSEDMTTANWTTKVGLSTVFDSTLGKNVTKIDLNFGSGAGFRRTNITPYFSSGVARVKLRGESGGELVTFSIFNSVGGSIATSALTLTSTWKVYSLAKNNATEDIAGFGVTRTSAQASFFYASEAQLENTTGQANQNPSEYVSNGVLTSTPYHGANVDGVKYFTTQNGNTVASNVIIEATGAAIANTTLHGYLAEGARTNLLLQSATPVTQDITVTAQTYTISMWGTGTCTLSGTGSGTLTGTGANNRVQLTFIPTAGTLILTFSGTNTNGQLEAGAFASSYIPTTTASVTRNTDVLTYPSAGNVDGTKGTAYSEIKTEWTSVPSPGVVFIETGTTPVGLFSSDNPTNNSANIRIYDGGNSVIKTGMSDMNTGVRKRASKWGAGAMAVTGDGLSPASGAFDGGIGGLETFTIGSTTRPSFCTIRNVKIWKKALTDTQLINLTK